ncbi:MAG: hypothetical protein LBT50_05650 [Prevotellaceae bacterium]|jgi:hypothetical protein|nr:hypothetical protein [Prevotellaceae bacterium]
MKKISLVSFLAFILLSSCGEIYKEGTGPVFDGTWTLFESYVDTVKVPLGKGKFLTAREFEGEQLLLFYSGGRYDSSFFFRFQDNNLFVRKVLDTFDVVHRYPQTDSIGNNVFDALGNQVFVLETAREVQKPLHPETNYAPEKYYGTCVFNEGAQLTLTINRYLVNESGVPTDKLYGRDIYSRPVEIE